MAAWNFSMDFQWWSSHGFVKRLWEGKGGDLFHLNGRVYMKGNKIKTKLSVSQ